MTETKTAEADEATTEIDDTPDWTEGLEDDTGASRDDAGSEGGDEEKPTEVLAEPALEELVRRVREIDDPAELDAFLGGIDDPELERRVLTESLSLPPVTAPTTTDDDGKQVETPMDWAGEWAQAPESVYTKDLAGYAKRGLQDVAHGRLGRSTAS